MKSGQDQNGNGRSVWLWRELITGANHEVLTTRQWVIKKASKVWYRFHFLGLPAAWLL